jgi:hypothetical protein
MIFWKSWLNNLVLYTGMYKYNFDVSW